MTSQAYPTCPQAEAPRADREEHRAIEHELPHYEQPAAAAIEALKIVQKHRGWVSDEAVSRHRRQARHLRRAVDCVATFYNLIYRRPVGRHVIHVCDSRHLLDHGTSPSSTHSSKHKLGISRARPRQTAASRCCRSCCLGTCDRAPAMMIDDDTHRDLETADEKKLDTILGQYK